ncbi:hypothetical protein Naga_102180g1 [Nannochloropsis gaditana]|uniref:Uncharacterized protein n=1 Tax=Nannochloropsis gaditana TaxID=72520 RepID=W7SYW1_9STRA|nr:hypothetical protein Naga_102180g1 [Nannochloropsis gaditana]
MGSSRYRFATGSLSTLFQIKGSCSRTEEMALLSTSGNTPPKPKASKSITVQIHGAHHNIVMDSGDETLASEKVYTTHQQVSCGHPMWVRLAPFSCATGPQPSTTH